MPESGRSQPSILALANHLIDWVMTSHPDPNVQTALSVPHIVPVPEDDPQQNPPDDPEGIQFISTRYTAEQEMEAVVKSMVPHLLKVVRGQQLELSLQEVQAANG